MNLSINKKYKIKVNVGLGLTSILLMLFVAFKILAPQYSRYIGIAIAVISFFIYIKYPKLRVSLLFAGGVALDDLMLGLFAAGIVLMTLAKRLIFQKISWTETLICINIILLMLINMYSGGDSINNATRLVALSIPLFFIISAVNITSRVNVRAVSIAYFILVAGQIIFFFVGDTNRASIFNGSENIAFALFAIMLIYIYAASDSKIEKLISTFMFIFFVITTESRTGVFVSMLILSWFLLRDFSFKRYSIILLILALLGLVFAGKVENLSEEYARYTNIAQYIVSGTFNFESLSLVDIRGAVYQEGMSIWENNKYFGVGAQSSTILQGMLRDNGMHEFHNIVIDLLVQYGAIGFILVVINYFLIFRVAISRSSSVFKKDIKFLILFYFGVGMVQPLVFNYQVVIFLYLCTLCLPSKPSDPKLGAHYA
jgi:O-antigen ligase